MLMKTYGKNILLRVFLASSIIILFLSAGNNIAQAKNDSIQYNNKVFTKKLYKNTAKITFRYTDAKSKKMIKKVYALLAEMKLEGKELDKNEPKKVGFVTVTIETKNNKKKKFIFQGDEMHVGSKKYIIAENNPLDEIREIYQSIRK